MPARDHAFRWHSCFLAMMLVVAVGLLTGCRSVQSIADSRGLALSAGPQQTLGHVVVTDRYLMFLGLVAAGSSDGDIQQTYDALAMEAGKVAGTRLDHLHVERRQWPLLPLIVHLHTDTVQATVVR
jgi:hypothetical protein